MKKKPGKGAVFALNLALPGLGQLVSGRWITGGIFLLLALLFFGLGVWFALAPLFAMIREMLDNPGSTAEYRIELVNVFVCFGLLILVWIVAVADGFRNPIQHKDTDNE